jgi:hypothetical protein
MPCPERAVLTAHAGGDPDDATGEGWTVAALEGHLAHCDACRHQVELLRRSIEAFRRVDLADLQPYDDAWQEELALQVEAGLDAAGGAAEAGSEHAGPVIPLRPTRPAIPGFAVVAAIAAALVLALWLSGPPGSTTSDEPTPVAVDSLAEQGRLLGRSLLDQALAEQDGRGGGELLASALDTETLLEELVDEHWSFHATIEDELDELTTDELQSLELRL